MSTTIDFVALLKLEKQKAKIESKVDNRNGDASSKINSTKESRNLLNNFELFKYDKPLSITFNFDQMMNYRIGNIDSMYYIPNFLTEREGQQLLCSINTWGENFERWQYLRTRRLQLWKSLDNLEKLDKQIEGETESSHSNFPLPLENLVETLVNSGIFDDAHRPNHILINDYKKDEGILHHTDGPNYFNKVAIISLNSSCLMTFRRNLSSDQIGIENGGDLFSVALCPNSLLLFDQCFYSDYMHGIASDKEYEIVGETIPCINKHLVDMNDGDIITRDCRTSITIRREYLE
jgi:hypothetical protein